MKIAVLGDGGMGTACAVLLASHTNCTVTLWSRLPERAAELRATGENRRFLPGVPISAAVQCTADAAEAVAGADFWVAAIPTLHLRATLARFGGLARAATPVVSVIKGIENGTLLRPSQILVQLLGERPVVVLSGPSHAEEIARHLPASVVAASRDESVARAVQQMFATERFRVYTNRDVLGVELAGALKNVIGIAAGVCDGLGFGDNAKSALLTRGLVEITRFGVALGAARETFRGLAGLGDLITTCVSRHGRNRAVGEALGRGRTLDEILASMQAVPEGVWTCRAVSELAAQRNIDMPITREVHQVLFGNKNPLEAVNDLMMREPKAE
jgi:glycerol-3-phosphate dehydrogenase (NAD(P)+)